MKTLELYIQWSSIYVKLSIRDLLFPVLCHFLECKLVFFKKHPVSSKGFNFMAKFLELHNALETASVLSMHHVPGTQFSFYVEKWTVTEN